MLYCSIIDDLIGMYVVAIDSKSERLSTSVLVAEDIELDNTR